jgi:hypothetical protein
MKQTVIQELIEEMERFSQMPMVNKITMEAAIDFAKLCIEKEKQQIIEAYYAGTAQFDNAAPMINPKTAEEYYAEISTS